MDWKILWYVYLVTCVLLNNKQILKVSNTANKSDSIIKLSRILNTVTNTVVNTEYCYEYYYEYYYEYCYDLREWLTYFIGNSISVITEFCRNIHRFMCYVGKVGYVIFELKP
jgi:hypothetical protein